MFPRMDKNRFGLTTFNAMYDFTENPPHHGFSIILDVAHARKVVDRFNAMC